MHWLEADLPVNGDAPSSAEAALVTLVVADRTVMEKIMDQPVGDNFLETFLIQMNLDGTDAEKTDLSLEFLNGIPGEGIAVNSRQENTAALYTMYGGFLFLGVFLGLLFLLATALIIYYKQISEGYEDQRRYQILRQVGMTDREIRASIRSQILMVFFLPLGMAGIHTAAAYPMVTKPADVVPADEHRPLYAVHGGDTGGVLCRVRPGVSLPRPGPMDASWEKSTAVYDGTAMRK